MGFAEDYIDVATRIVEFRDKYPHGSLQPADPANPFRVETIGDLALIVVVAAAYRTPDDPRPGIGMAQEPFPGRTPYTRGSELQNAETSAWGRAIVAALAADTRKGIATAEEVRNREAEREEPAQPRQSAYKRGSDRDRPVGETTPITDGQKKLVHTLLGKLGVTDKETKLAGYAHIIGRQVGSTDELTKGEAHRIIDDLNARLGQGVDTDPTVDEGYQP